MTQGDAREPRVTNLPAFPWDRLSSAKEDAARHPGGIADLSVGTPVDPVPALVREALAAAADSPGYPTTHGSEALRESITGWLSRACGATVDPQAVLPAIGSKELIAWLPSLLGIGSVAYPSLAYPTYDIGARLAGAGAQPYSEMPGEDARLIWVNSPSNPTGRVLPADRLREIVDWARERGAIVASDECYLTLGWDAAPVSILDPAVCGGSHDGLLAVHSLSKRSNLAGYRAGFAAGDPALIARLLAVRKHAGMMMPAPVQAAMAAALNDDAHAAEQRSRYAVRRARLRQALETAGWKIEHSEAGLYLWATRGGIDCWDQVRLLAKAGILVAPGEFYGAAGRDHVRVAFTATDERVDTTCARLASLPT